MQQPDPIYTCMKCGKYFTRNYIRKRHEMSCGKIRQCKECEKVFSSAYDGQRHLDVCGLPSPAKRVKQEPNKLSTVPNNKGFGEHDTSFSGRGKSLGLKSGQAVPIYTCMKCGKYFTRNIRKRHEMSCGKIHQCKECGKVFSSAYDGQPHLDICGLPSPAKRVKQEPNELSTIPDDESSGDPSGSVFTKTYNEPRHRDVSSLIQAIIETLENMELDHEDDWGLVQAMNKAFKNMKIDEDPLENMEIDEDYHQDDWGLVQAMTKAFKNMKLDEGPLEDMEIDHQDDWGLVQAMNKALMNMKLDEGPLEDMEIDVDSHRDDWSSYSPMKPTEL